jgi:LEA14-like dessication related protein
MDTQIMTPAYRGDGDRPLARRRKAWRSSREETHMRSLNAAWAVVVGLSGLLAACASLSLEPPRINIANVTMKEMKLFEQVYDLELRIQNPNDSELDVTGLKFDLDINDRFFGSGVSDQRLTIGRLNSGVIRVETVTTLVGFARQVLGAATTGLTRVSYRITGTLFVGTPTSRLPFDDKGEMDFPVASQ